MSLVEVRKELAARLGQLGDLRVYGEPLGVLPELPAAIIRPGQPLAEYGGTLAGNDVTFNFEVLLLTRSGDGGEAWAELAAYVAPTGAGSLKAAVDTPSDANANANTNSNTRSGADWYRVVRATEGGRVTYGKVNYWGVSFQVQVYLGG